MPKGVYIKSKEHLQKMNAHLKNLNGKGENSPAWKGDNVGYHGVHRWVVSVLGQPSFCSECGCTDVKKYQWANISGEYKRDITDYKRLCPKCHIIFDKGGRTKILIPGAKNHKKQLKLF